MLPDVDPHAEHGFGRVIEVFDAVPSFSCWWNFMRKRLDLHHADRS
jgi:hypothetical protein